jgi:hypothetical protein
VILQYNQSLFSEFCEHTDIRNRDTHKVVETGIGSHTLPIFETLAAVHHHEGYLIFLSPSHIYMHKLVSIHN